ncbi:MAG: DUF1826 domain-containing protein [Pseudomonadota bacterium]
MSETIQLPPETRAHNNVRRSVESEQPAVFTDFFRKDTNITIWRRSLSSQLQSSLVQFLEDNAYLQEEIVVTPQNAFTSISKLFSTSACKTELSEDIAELVDMFCTLFELEQAGLRLKVLHKPMCPRFHVDNVPCRLVTTYQGIATEWLPHDAVDRTKLGTGNNGLPDELSGLFQNEQDIRQLTSSDVALFKGELWPGNKNAGLVHRSPSLPSRERRLLLTLDFVG